MFFRSKPATFTDLPQDILLEIFSYLSPEQALTLSNVNRFAHTALQNELFWQKKFLMHFPDFHEEMRLDSDNTWQTKFQTTYLSQYSRLSAYHRKLFSLVKENDINALQKIPINLTSDLGVMDSQYGSLLSWAQRMGHQAVLDCFYPLGSHLQGILKIQWAIACHQSNAQIMLWDELFNDSNRLDKFIHLAASAGNIPLSQALLAKQPGLLKEKNRSGYTPLLLATMQGHTQLVRYLLAQGAEIEADYSGPGTQSLALAISRGYSEIVALLLQAGAKTTISSRYRYQQPIHLAARFGHLGCLKLLLDTDPGLLEQVDYNGYTPLLTASAANQKKIIAYLIAQGANLEASPSSSSLYHEKATPVVLIVDSANLTAYTYSTSLDDEKSTALILAVAHGSLEVVDILLAAGANPLAKARLYSSKIEYQVFHLAILQNNVGAQEILLTYYPELIESQTSDGLTPLQLAIKQSKPQSIAYLLLAMNKTKELTQLPAACKQALTPPAPASEPCSAEQASACVKLEQYIRNKKSHYTTSTTFFSKLVSKFSTSSKKLAAAKALEAVVTTQTPSSSLEHHLKQFNSGKLGKIYRQFRKS